MMRLWDYECTAGHVSRSVPYDASTGPAPEKMTCPEKGCRRVASWAMMGEGSKNHIHATKSSMYGRYEPGLGEFVESYDHKKRLMREYGVEESSDATGGSKSYRPDDPPPRAPNNSQFIGEGDLEKMQAEAVARAAQGDFDMEIE